MAIGNSVEEWGLSSQCIIGIVLWSSFSTFVSRAAQGIFTFLSACYYFFQVSKNHLSSDFIAYTGVFVLVLVKSMS